MVDTRYGPYEVLDRIGEGGMGIVYRGRDSTSGAAVAVKTARPESHHALSSLRSEIEALARIHHPSIVRILDHGARDGVPWYAMDLLEGETWSDFRSSLWPGLTATGDVRTGGDDDTQLVPATVPRRGALSSRAKPEAGGGRLFEVLSLTRKLCTALTVLHAEGFVHRDLKPSNVLLVAGRPVLTDLGIVTRFRGAVGRERIEVSGQMMGTVRYMAPEQAEGQLVDARADLFALGMMLFETVTGRLPFSASTSDRWLQAILNQTPPPMSAFVDGVPLELEQLVAGLLCRAPRDRIGHADDVAMILESLGAEPDPLAPTTSRSYLYRPQITGREESCMVMEEALGGAQLGQGQMILIGGESGVGKTVLASDAARRAILRGMMVITGECLPLNLGHHTTINVQSLPLHPLRPLLLHVVDICQAAGPERVERLLGDGRGKTLAAYEPALAQLPGIAGQSVRELPSALAQLRLLDCVQALLLALIEETGPIVLMLDDLQWVDETTRAVLSHLADHELSRMKMLLVGTYRADEISGAAAEFVIGSPARRIDLDRLDERGVGAMVSDMLAHRSPPPGFVSFLTQQTEGNPFFVAEYLRLAADEGLVRRDFGRWNFQVEEDTPEAYARLQLPASLQDLIGRRLEGVSEDSRAVLEVASVLGRQTDRALLEAVIGSREDALDQAINELVVRQILEADGGVFRFAHDKLRETTYNRIEDDRRRELNRAAALAMETRLIGQDAPVDYGRLAQFWTEAGVWSKAIDALERSAQSDLREYSNRQAIETLETMFTLCEEHGLDVGSTRRGQWERALAEANIELGRDFEGRRHLERALTRLRQPGLPTGALAQGWAVLSEMVRLVAQNCLRPLFPRKRGVEAVRTGEAALAYNRLLENMLRNNETVLAMYANFRNVRLAERVPPSPALARGYAMLSYIVCLTPLQGVAARVARRAMKTAENLGLDATTIYVISRVGAYQETVGLWAGAQAGFDRGLALAQSIGDRKQEYETYHTRAVGMYVQGDFRRRLEVLEVCLKSAAERGDARYEGFSSSGLIECYVRLGMDAEVRSALPSLERWARGEREQSEAVWAHGAFAFAAWHLSDEERARAEADHALALMRESKPQVFLLTPPLWELCEIYLALAEGNADATDADAGVVRRHLGELVALLVAFSKLIRSARPYAKLAEAGWAWRSGHPKRAARQWKEALALAQEMEAKHAEARACYDLGRHQSAGPEREQLLERAITLFDEMGARPESGRARLALTSGRVPL